MLERGPVLAERTGPNSTKHDPYQLLFGRVLGRQVGAAGPHPMIEDRNGTAKDRHKHQDGDQLQYGVPIDIREQVHAAIVVAARR